MIDRLSEQLGKWAGTRDTDTGQYLYQYLSVVNCVLYGGLIFLVTFAIEAIINPHWTTIKTFGYPGLLLSMLAIVFLRLTRRPGLTLMLGAVNLIAVMTAAAYFNPQTMIFAGMFVLVGMPLWALLLMGRRDGLIVSFFASLSAAVMIWVWWRNGSVPADQLAITTLGIGLALVVSTVGGVVVLYLQDDARRTLSEARNRAEAASAEKSSFIASISHDVRTPLTSLVGVLQLIEQRSVDPETLDLVKTANGSARNLLGLIDDLLDLSKIEVGALKLKPKPINLTDLFHSTVEAYRSTISEKGLSLEVVGPNRPVWIAADELRLSQILLNFLTNAIKFTDEGTITATLDVAEHDMTSRRIRLSVRDTGHGLTEAAQAVIFDRFVQADNPDKTIQVGSGLGLAIVRDLATIMKGDVGVESALDEGSLFWFEATFPFAQPIAQPPGLISPTASSRAGLRILLVDDNEGNQKVLSRLLGAMGHTVESAANGQIGVDRARREPEMDLILMDMRMPVMDGEAAIREIRASDAPACNLPIIALSADDEELERLRTLGADDFLRKPIDLPELARAIGHVVGDVSRSARN